MRHETIQEREREVLDRFGKKSEPTQPTPPYSFKHFFPHCYAGSIPSFPTSLSQENPRSNQQQNKIKEKKRKLHNYGATSILIGPDAKMEEGVAVLLVPGGEVLNVGGGGIVVVVVVVAKSEQGQVEDVLNEKVVKVSLSSLSNGGMEEDDIVVGSVNVKGERGR
jgi:hypothetical protein